MVRAQFAKNGIAGAWAALRGAELEAAMKISDISHL